MTTLTAAGTQHWRFVLPLAVLLGISAGGPVSAEQVAPTTAKLNAGEWHARIDLPDLSQYGVRTTLWVRANGRGRFDADSRSGAIGDAYGFWSSAWLKISSSKARRGAWLHIKSGKQHGDGRLTGTLSSMFTVDLALACEAVSGGFDCLLHHPGRRTGKLSLRRVAPDGWLRGGYDQLRSNIENQLQENLFQPSVLRSSKWGSFLGRFEAALESAHDDLDVLAAWYRVAGSAPVSHLALMRGSPVQLRPQTGADDLEVALAAAVQLEWRDEVAVLRIKTFGLGVEAMRERLRQLFKVIVERPAKALVIDLRGNKGGNFSSMFVAAHLSSTPTPAGYFVGNLWWRKHDSAPEYQTAANVLPRFDQPSMNLFVQTMRESGGLYGVVVPLQPRFDGPVYMLSDRRSASATEPLLYHLQRTGRAVVVGQATAGAMLSSDVVELGDGWSLMLPVADYYAADGVRLESRGVIPDVAVPADQALARAQELAEQVVRQD